MKILNSTLLDEPKKSVESSSVENDDNHVGSQIDTNSDVTNEPIEDADFVSDNNDATLFDDDTETEEANDIPKRLLSKFDFRHELKDKISFYEKEKIKELANRIGEDCENEMVVASMMKAISNAKAKKNGTDKRKAKMYAPLNRNKTAALLLELSSPIKPVSKKRSLSLEKENIRLKQALITSEADDLVKSDKEKKNDASIELFSPSTIDSYYTECENQFTMPSKCNSTDVDYSNLNGNLSSINEQGIENPKGFESHDGVVNSLHQDVLNQIFPVYSVKKSEREDGSWVKPLGFPLMDDTRHHIAKSSPQVFFGRSSSVMSGCNTFDANLNESLRVSLIKNTPHNNISNSVSQARISPVMVSVNKLEATWKDSSTLPLMKNNLSDEINNYQPQDVFVRRSPIMASRNKYQESLMEQGRPPIMANTANNDISLSLSQDLFNRRSPIMTSVDKTESACRELLTVPLNKNTLQNEIEKTSSQYLFGRRSPVKVSKKIQEDSLSVPLLENTLHDNIDKSLPQDLFGRRSPVNYTRVPEHLLYKNFESSWKEQLKVTRNTFHGSSVHQYLFDRRSPVIETEKEVEISTKKLPLLNHDNTLNSFHQCYFKRRSPETNTNRLISRDEKLIDDISDCNNIKTVVTDDSPQLNNMMGSDARDKILMSQNKGTASTLIKEVKDNDDCSHTNEVPKNLISPAQCMKTIDAYLDYLAEKKRQEGFIANSNDSKFLNTEPVCSKGTSSDDAILHQNEKLQTETCFQDQQKMDDTSLKLGSVEKSRISGGDNVPTNPLSENVSFNTANLPENGCNAISFYSKTTQKDIKLEGQFKEESFQTSTKDYLETELSSVKVEVPENEDDCLKRLNEFEPKVIEACMSFLKQKLNKEQLHHQNADVSQDVQTVSGQNVDAPEKVNKTIYVGFDGQPKIMRHNPRGRNAMVPCMFFYSRFRFCKNGYRCQFLH